VKTTCENCDPGHFLHLVDHNCYETCPARYVGNSTYGNCIACQKSNCDQCTTDSVTCTLCSSSYYFLEPNCVMSCGNGYYADSTNRLCVKCDDKNCTNCATNKDICTQCLAGFFLYSNICWERCPLRTAEVTSPFGNCQACTDSLCLNCTTNKAICQQCQPFAYLMTGSGLCYSPCPSEYGQNSTNGLCVSCQPSNCLNCTGDGLTCTSCDVGRYLYNGVCVATCPSGYTETTYRVC
jgi:hypothetical protein